MQMQLHWRTVASPQLAVNALLTLERFPSLVNCPRPGGRVRAFWNEAEEWTWGLERMTTQKTHTLQT